MRGVKHGIQHSGGKIKHGIKTASSGPRVGNDIPKSGGGVSQHSGQVPKIKNSVNHSISQMISARSKSHPSTHPVRIPGGKFSGKVRGK